MQKASDCHLRYCASVPCYGVLGQRMVPLRQLSTAHPVAPYARSVPRIPYHHTLPQYRSSRRGRRGVSGAVCARSVPRLRRSIGARDLRSRADPSPPGSSIR
eukprot:2463579-Rhodomonas_salina.1